MSTPPLVPKFQKLYLCRYGWNGGRQICLFLGYADGGYFVRKWLANSGRWTARVAIRSTDLLAAASQADCSKLHVDVSKL